MSVKKWFRRIFAIALVVLTMCSVFIPTYAATSGSTGSYTIHVTTKSNWFYPGNESITLTQNKQTITYEKIFGNGTKTKTGYYGTYTIRIENLTKDTSKNVVWSDTKNYKINLERDCNYRITVTYDSTATTIFSPSIFGYSFKKITSPYWWVSSTWKVSSCR